MPFLNYREKKAKGLIELRREEESEEIEESGVTYTAVFKKFDPEEGTEIDPEIRTFGISGLEEHKLELKERIKDLDAFLVDVKKL